MKYTLSFALVFFIILCSCTQSNKEQEFVENILSQMTLQEKIGQLNQLSIGDEWTGPSTTNQNIMQMVEDVKEGKVGSVLNTIGNKKIRAMQKIAVENSRLGIPLLFAYDVIHGFKTMFPIPLAEACAWDTALMRQTAVVAAKEAAASGLNWTFAPMVDVSYDARWGRVMETAGEDTWFGVQAAVARIKGFQGNDLSNEYTIAACAKHFAGYGFVEAGKDYNNVHLGTNALNNIVLPPFKAAAQAGVATFMNAFNDIDGVPSTGNQYLLREKLKGDWDYKGIVVSDWNSIGEMVIHGFALDKKHAAELAINAGCDIDMMTYGYIEHLEELLAEGKLDLEMIDDAVRRILTLKYKLGLFDDPYKYCDAEREKKTILHKDHIALAKEAALKSMVLLKNNNALLPLSTTQKVALIGPFAKDKEVHLGNWRAQGSTETVTPLYDILKEQFGTNLSYALGCNFDKNSKLWKIPYELSAEDNVTIKEAVKVAKSAQTVVMVLGETTTMIGESNSRAFIELPVLQKELLKAVYKVNKNIVLLLASGRPLALQWEMDNIPAIFAVWHSGQQAPNAIADILLGMYNPSGKTVMTWPRYSGQCPVHYNFNNTGRPAFQGQDMRTTHIDVSDTLLIPFGYGLSYTTFNYSKPTISSALMEIGQELHIQVALTNTGKVAGTETVQLYIHDVSASVIRPVKELAGFKQIYLNPEESINVNFTLKEEDLRFYNQLLEYVSEPGDFEVFVGSNSVEVKQLNFKLVGQY